MARNYWAPVILWNFQATKKVKGLEHLDPRQPYIVMANHSSFLDIPILFRSLPFYLFFIAKKELKRLPFLGWFMMAAKMIFIDRKNRNKAKESIRQAGVLIKNGQNVVIFPEGTASRDGEIGPFKKGGFHLALQSEVPILPIRIEGTGTIWPRGKFLSLKKGEVKVIIGAPIHYEDYKDMEVGKFAESVRETIISLK